MHADNDSSLILDQIREAEFDMVETFTTEPQVRCTLAQARQMRCIRVDMRRYIQGHIQ